MDAFGDQRRSHHRNQRAQRDGDAPDHRRADAEQPERHAADQPLNQRHNETGADAGDHEIARVAEQAIAVVARKRQAIAQPPAQGVAVAEKKEQREQHREQIAERREEIDEDAAGARRQEREQPARGRYGGKTLECLLGDWGTPDI